MQATEVFAPAKINLTLHVTGQREDGYHLLDSLVMFAPAADVVHIAPAETLSLRVSGPEAAAVPDDGRNLVMKAAAMLSQHLPGAQGVSIRLDKHLPAASGIGGGSADAAAALRGLLHLWQTEAGPGNSDWLADGMLRLGADVPMCLGSHPARVRGIGDLIEPVRLPALPAVLVNPRVEVSTPAVFRALARRANPPMPSPLPRFDGPASLIDWLATQRNDLEAAALSIEPAIGTVLAALRDVSGCRLARMSGSGATCFGLFDSTPEAEAAARRLRAAHGDWWIASGDLGDQSVRARPRPGQP